jgi:hypothetical protein
MIGSSLRLTYVGLVEQDMLDILLHYQDTQGIYFNFALPANTLSGLTAADYTLTGFSWRYATPPTILDLPCDRYTVEVELESVESKPALISVGLRGRVGLSLLGGGAFAANGIDAEIGFSLDSGTFGTAGFDYTIALAVVDNGATGEAFASGASELITIGLLGAEATGAVDVDGFNGQVELSLDPGVAGIASFVNGFSEIITVSLAGGAADGGGAAPVIEGYAIAPIELETSEWEYSALGFEPMATVELSPSLQLELAAVELL